MLIGKFPEISYKRAVLKKMNRVSEGLKPGVDAAPINLEDVTAVMSSNCILKWFDGCETFYLQKTCNALYEKGGTPTGIQLIVHVPEKYEERILGKKIQNINDAAKAFGIPIVQCRVYKGETKELLIHITVIGTTKNNLCTGNVKPGMKLVMAGAAGIGGSVILNELYREKLAEKFTSAFLRECDEFKNMLSVKTAARIALSADVCYMHDISDGGVFGAVWEVGSATNKGVYVDVKKIPIWQQTIEMAEVFDINPYMMEGTGAIIIVCENGKDVVKSLLEQNIPAEIIGEITGNQDRVIINGDETRFLEPPHGDALYDLELKK